MLNFHVLLILMVFHKLNFEYFYVHDFCCIFCDFIKFCCVFTTFCCDFLSFCCVFAMFCCVFLSFAMFCCVLVVKISLFLRFRFGFIVDNNFSVLIPLFCAIKLIIEFGLLSLVQSGLDYPIGLVERIVFVEFGSRCAR